LNHDRRQGANQEEEGWQSPGDRKIPIWSFSRKPPTLKAIKENLKGSDYISERSRGLTKKRIPGF